MTPRALADLHALCFTMQRPWQEDEFAALLQGPGVFLLAEPRAFLMGRVIADEAELLTLAVHPKARRAGQGLALVNRFEADAAQRGAAHLFLEVAETNAPARALYERAGYAVTGRRKSYYARPSGDPVDALIMGKPLRK